MIVKFKPKQTIMVMYLISLFNMVHTLQSYAYTNFQSVANSNHYIFRWIDPSVDVNSVLSFICPPFMVALFLLFPLLQHQWARVLWGLSFFFIQGFQFTYLLSHSSHAIVWVCIFLALIPGNLNLYDNEHPTLQAFLRLCQLQIFVIYGLAGIWKGLGFIESFSNPNITSGLEYVQYAMSSEFMYSNRVYASAAWVSEHPRICALLSALVLLTQLGSTLVAFFPKYYFWWGLVLVIFHIGTLFTVNVFFYWSVPTVFALLCLCPMPDRGFKPIRSMI